MKKSIIIQLLLPVGTAVVLVIGALGYTLSLQYVREVEENASQQVLAQSERTMELLNVVDDLNKKRVATAMELLKERAQRLGPARLSGSVAINGAVYGNILFGGTPQGNSPHLVDAVKSMSGAAATIFVRSSDGFIRIATNVQKSDGTRALGTPLDPNGKAYAAIRTGASFTGVVDILGMPYMTSYEPIVSANSIIGVYYTGYRIAELSVLNESITRSRIMENGFTALADNKGNLLFHSSSVTPEMVQTVLTEAAKEQNPEWNVERRTFEQWGYTVITAYPQDDITHHIALVRWITIGAGVITVVMLMMIIIFFMRRLVSAPVNAISATMRNADIHTRFNDPRMDEIGVLSGSFDQFVRTIRDTLDNVNDTLQSIVPSMAEIGTSTQHMAVGSAEQASQAAEVAASISTITNSIEQNTKNAASTEASAMDSKRSAEAGEQEVRQTIGGMREIAEVVNSTAETIRVLGEASTEIGSIVTVIQEIADQTNLLALNAAIEAARAGDQGRGFAVVADEVRKLADRTTKATQEISGTILRIQTDTGQAVRSIEHGKGKVESGISMAEQAGSTLAEIKKSSEKVSDMVKMIAADSRLQTEALQQISANIRSISDVSADNAKETETMARAAGSLNDMVDRLQNEVNRFYPDRSSMRAGRLTTDDVHAPPARRDRTFQPV